MANFDILKAQIAQLIPDNTEQAITAQDVRDSFDATIDAINAAKEDEGAIAPAQWGGITGDLEDQTDLKNALDAKQDVIADLGTIRSGAAAGAIAYQKPSGGIPKTDLDNDVQSSLGKADTAVQPAAVADVVKYSAQSLTDAQKGQARTNIGALGSADVASLTAEEYVEVASLPTADATTLGKIYLVGPDGNGDYDRYITSYDGVNYTWQPIGSTSIDMSGYATKEEVDQLEQKVTDLEPMSQLYKSQQTIAGTEEHGQILSANGYYVPSSANYYVWVFPVSAGVEYTIKATLISTAGSVAAVSFYAGASLPTTNTYVTEVIQSLGTPGSYEDTYTPANNGFILIADKINSNPATSDVSVTTSSYIDFQSEINTLDGEIIDSKKAQNYYDDGFVTYSTGAISPSSGGAKLYIIYRDMIPSRATKIFARICTQSTAFAAIAFYSERIPDVSCFVSAVQGATSNDPSLFVATIPSPNTWECCLITNMSQLYATPLIYLDVVNTLNPEYVDNNVNGVVSKVEEAKSIFNIFAGKPFYHHLNQEQSADKQTIPAQSLLDVTYAKRLGASLIEASIHKCSDDVYVVKHGNAGKLGEGLSFQAGSGLSSVTLFSAVSSTDLRQYVTYDCNRPKYNVHIPTFDEFCAKCKQEAVGVKISYNADGLAIARKYLPDDMIFITAGTRPDGFRGTVEYVFDPNNQTVAQCIASCNAIGAPLQIVILAGAIDNLSDDDFCDLVLAAHNAGYTVGIVYTNLEKTIKYLGLGADGICSSFKQINLFDEGNALNLADLSDTKLVLSDGASYNSGNDTISLPTGGKVTVSPATPFVLGKLCVNIRFSGTISVKHGGINYIYYNLSGYQSDGNEMISYAVAINPFSASNIDQWVEISADASTTIYELKLAGSVM